MALLLIFLIDINHNIKFIIQLLLLSKCHTKHLLLFYWSIPEKEAVRYA